MQQQFAAMPATFVPYCKVFFSSKPLLAPLGPVMPALQFSVKNLRIKPQHLHRYRMACGLVDNDALPPAYLHALAMPLHLRIFTHPLFPVKVVGLVQLRNIIRQLQPIKVSSSLDLSVQFEGWRETDGGQEYDFITRCEIAGVVVWEEVSTMLARRATPGKRPSIERAMKDAARIVDEQTVAVTGDTGRRYAWVSGDINPIHLFDRTAQAFQFKQAVAHGMWSLARCLGLAEGKFERQATHIEAQFKLPIYLPG